MGEHWKGLDGSLTMEELQNILNETRMSKAELADYVDISYVTVNSWFLNTRNRRVIPPNELRRIALIFWVRGIRTSTIEGIVKQVIGE